MDPLTKVVSENGGLSPTDLEAVNAVGKISAALQRKCCAGDGWCIIAASILVAVRGYSADVAPHEPTRVTL